ncbi:large-conductance mechanosensitive channel protein MscL [Fredinandcohnia sp. 179-A 10B2 NHS]|uniref:large-conductance mechanosensitive channel protein MscL n=1 Tax=Fredinandcohnia sp. 179-A 10B2 NHS TaxID=3235176 RepID=UPI0039A186BB
MLNEFKKFALKGNVIDLAVGVVIGGAFGKIVSSLVNDIIMPIFGFILGGINIKEASYKFLNYGAFIQTIIDFLIISFSIFLFIRFFNRFKKKELEEPTVEPTPTKEELLLTEIRDLLKAQQK